MEDLERSSEESHIAHIQNICDHIRRKHNKNFRLVMVDSSEHEALKKIILKQVKERFDDYRKMQARCSDDDRTEDLSHENHELTILTLVVTKVKGDKIEIESIESHQGSCSELECDGYLLWE